MGPILIIKLLFSMPIIKGIVHPKMQIWCLSAYPQGIQDVGDFVSSVEHKQRFLTQTVAVCQSYNGSQWDPRLWESKKNIHRQNKIKPCGSWRYIEVLRHETIGLCKKLNSIYIIFYLWSTAMSNCPERVHNSWRVTHHRALA